MTTQSNPGTHPLLVFCAILLLLSLGHMSQSLTTTSSSKSATSMLRRHKALTIAHTTEKATRWKWSSATQSFSVSTKLRLSSGSSSDEAPPLSLSLLQSKLLTALQPIADLTRTTAWSYAETVIVLILLSAIDGGFSGDWSNTGLISNESEEWIRNSVVSVGIFHLFFCAPIAALASKAKQHPVAPAVLHVLLIGGLGLAKVLFATDETKCTIPTAAGTLYSLKQTLANIAAGSYDEQAVRDSIDTDIAGNAVVLYSFRKCPYCLVAKRILIDELGMGEYLKVVELDEDKKTGYPIRAELGKRTGRTSVPSIFVGGTFIGGCNDGPKGGLVAMKEDGSLQALLASAVEEKKKKVDSSSNSNGGAWSSLSQRIEETYYKARPYAFFLLPVILYAAAELSLVIRGE